MHYQELYFKQYPLGTMQDYIKYIYQATLGSAHLVANQEDNYQYLIKEYETIEYDEEHILFEEISEELVRVHLEAIPKAYLAYYHHFFMLSVDVKEDKQKLIDALLHAEDIPFSKEEGEIGDIISQYTPTAHVKIIIGKTDKGFIVAHANGSSVGVWINVHPYTDTKDFTIIKGSKIASYYEKNNTYPSGF